MKPFPALLLAALLSITGSAAPVSYWFAGHVTAPTIPAS
jgi:hypothetical protein